MFILQLPSSFSVKEKEIVECHYLGKTNSFVVKFPQVGKGSDHEKIISQCRKLMPEGFCVNIMEAPCDSGMYFLLGCMQATGQISGKNFNIVNNYWPIFWNK